MTRLALISAMHDEMAALLPLLSHARVERRAGRDFHLGELAGRPVVLVRSGIGKVAAATTAAVLLDAYACTALVFTGVAGGVGPGVAVGDLVLARSLLQHDLDVSPLFPRWHVPGAGRAEFATDAGWTDRLAQAATRVLARPPAELAAFGHAAPRLHQGLVISGDRFVATATESLALQAALPLALAVEMEGAAVAQVCHDFDRPLALVRSISDRADDQASVDFPRFLQGVAAPYAQALIQALLQA